MLLFCRTCLAMDVKLIKLEKYQTKDIFRNVTQINIDNMKGLPNTVCVECYYRVINCHKFKEKCVLANSILTELIQECDKLSKEQLEAIDRANFNLKSNLSVSLDFKQTIIYFEYEDKVYEKENTDPGEPWASVVKTEVPIEMYNDEKFEISDDKSLFDSEKFEIIGNAISEHKVNNTDYSEFNENSDQDENFTPDNDKAQKSDSSSDDDVPLKKAKLKLKCKVKKKDSKRAKTRKPTEYDSVEKIDRRRKPLVTDDMLSTLLSVRKLTLEEQIEEIAKRQESSNFKNSVHKCMVCYKGFLDKSAFDSHMLRHSDQFGKFECNVCHLRFRNGNALKKHTTASHTEMYNCNECSYYTTHRFSAKLHINWHKGKKYKCEHCGEEFVRFTTYMGHVRIKHASDYVCELCGFAFVSPKGIDLHKRLKHAKAQTIPDDGPFCELCNVRFLSEAAFEQHTKVSARHGYDREERRQYPNRPKQANKKNYKKNFEAADNDKSNEEITCEQCGVKVIGSRAYHTHFRRMHPDKNRTVYPAMKTPCMCEVCGRIFQSHALLRDHSFSHSSTPANFQCSECNKTFRMKQRLVTHMHVHSEQRVRHACHVCGKSFSHAGNRRRHAIIHTGLRPFKCEMCSKTFKSQCEKRSHVNYVHLKKPWPKRNRGKQRARQGQNVPLPAGASETTMQAWPPCDKINLNVMLDNKGYYD